MSDKTKAERDAQPSSGSASESPSPNIDLSRVPSAGASLPQVGEVPLSGVSTGFERRLDGAHEFVSAKATETAVENPPDKNSEVAFDNAAAPVSSATGHLSPSEDDLILQANQLAEHLRGQFSDLDRREKTLSEQLALLDQERRNVRLWVHQFEEEMLDREKKLSTRESEFQQKLSACETLVTDLEVQEQAIQGARDDLDVERSQLKESVGHELEADHAALKHSQQVLEGQQKQLSQQIEDNRLEHEEALREVFRQQEADRVTIREQVISELDAERVQMGQERDEWIAHRDAEIQEIQKERELTDKAVERSQAELKSLRDVELSELDKEGQQQARTLEEDRQQFEADLTQREQEWSAKREAELQDVERERAHTDSAVKKSQQELSKREQEFEHRLAQDRQTFEQERKQEEDQLRQERGILENRIQFQQDHLQKAREQLEADRRELRLEHQQTTNRFQQQESLLRLRRYQLDHHLALLEERENSVQREHELQVGSHREFETELKRDRERLRNEREAWNQERVAQGAEIRRQQDLLSVHSESLEGRRERIDKLRAEVDETHRITLELRMAIEEAWDQFSRAAGSEVAQRHVDETREALNEHYRHVNDELEQRRTQLSELQTGFHNQKNTFLEERRKLTEWIAERDEQLRLWEQQLAGEVESLEAREKEWRDVRDGWVHEKIEAEQIIRGLLEQLSALNLEADSPASEQDQHSTSPDSSA